MAPKWLHIALDEVGQKEVPGSGNNPRVIEYHSATTLHSKEDQVPWCAAFVSWCLEQSSTASTKSAWAKSYLNWGKKLDTPKVGCVVVFTRGTNSGHVAFYLGEDADYVHCLGGNQSDQVCVSKYLKAHLLGYRWPN